MGLVRSILKDKSLHLELWGETINTHVYVLNRSSTNTLHGKTPYEMWSRKKPKLSHLRIFSSIVDVKTLRNFGKLEDRSKEMIFMRHQGLLVFQPSHAQGSFELRCQ